MRMRCKMSNVPNIIVLRLQMCAACRIYLFTGRGKRPSVYRSEVTNRQRRYAESKAKRGMERDIELYGIN